MRATDFSAASAREPVVDVVRGRTAGRLTDELVRFWGRRSGLDEQLARRAAADAVAVLRDPAGEVLGALTARPAAIDQLGGRTLWLARATLAEGHEGAAPALAGTAHATLEDVPRAADGPLGTFLLLEPEQAAADREPDWPGAPFVLATRGDDGRHGRVAWFAGVRLGSGPPVPAPPAMAAPDEDVRFAALEGHPTVGPADVLDLWVREAGLAPAEARRRLDEVLLVATGERGRLAGVSTAYLRRCAPLAMDLWHVRAFVAPGRRGGAVALRLLGASWAALERGHREGDRRAPGVALEVEHAGLRGRFDQAVWPRTGFVYVGESASGVPLRVRYFPGAQLPA